MIFDSGAKNHVVRETQIKSTTRLLECYSLQGYLQDERYHVHLRESSRNVNITSLINMMCTSLFQAKR